MPRDNNIPIGPEIKPIGEEQIKNFIDILQKYKRGKANLEEKIIANEEWWKLRHWKDTTRKHIPATAWLWNVIVSKHADMEDGYPEPNILAREEGDKHEAQMLSSILPVVLEQNEFHKTYSDCAWYKLKQGACIYGIFWDGQKLNGLGDIAVKKIDAINLFWEPGITDIQKSQYVFHAELIDNDILKSTYPELTDKVLSNDGYVAKYLYDDEVETTDKSTVIDVYYHKSQPDGKQVLHYVKFCGQTVLYATENEPTWATRGLYDHGKYPFVFDSLFDIEGSPFGYGYTDICGDTQVTIDQMNAAIAKNAMMASIVRYLANENLDINKEQFANWEEEIISVSSPMTTETLQQLNVNPLPGTYVDILNNQIEMLKETSGNRDVANGGTTSGVTSASGIAALQEASSKSSRDTLANTYEAYKEICIQIIELIRQFYDTPRQFRIVGERGMQEYVTYDNSGIAPQYQGNDFGIDMGYRVPQFDIKVSAQKASPYTKIAQNELAIQFFNLGFFNPQMADQAVACLDMMDFDDKDELIRKIERNGTIAQTLEAVLQVAFTLAQRFDPSVIPSLQQAAMQAQIPMQTPEAVNPGMVQTDNIGQVMPEEHPFVRRAREQAQTATQPR